MISTDPTIEAADTAFNGVFALEKMEKKSFDLILLDIEMPQMDGVEFLVERRERGIKTPVVVLSSLGRNRPELTLKCMDLGASDFILKPSGTVSLDIEKVKDEVISKIKFFAKQAKEGGDEPQVPVESKKDGDFSPAIPTERKTAPKDSLSKAAKENIDLKINKMKSIDVLAIGISTGGPNALRTMLPQFPADFPLPILIVQHMPPGFTREFAKGLHDICPMTVKEAEDEDAISVGTIYIAPGNKHMTVTDSGGLKVIKLNDDAPVLGHRPSVEVLFDSVAEQYGNRVISVIMTGMGKDGAKGIKKIWSNGGITLAQDEKSCVVFGMPKVAIDSGAIDEVLPLNDLPQRINDIVNRLYAE